MTLINKFPIERKHTLCFLKQAKKVASIFINTEIDMTNIVSIKNKLNSHIKLSYISFIIYSISRVLESNPVANSAYRSGISPKLVAYNSVNAKFTLDKIINGTQAVVSAVISNSQTLSIKEIQDEINYYKNSNVDIDPKFKSIRLLHTIPLMISQLLFKYVMGIPKRSLEMQGSFTISSLGHHPVDSFVPMSLSTLSFGVGQIRDRAIVCNGKIFVKPTLILNMVFDHRVIDGALSSNILNEIKNELENFSLTNMETI
jgi:pyruvate/2-oxoglutarate dehydrogenase complex dihydrolipoamide acyltransferase (E2) component